MNFKYLLAVIFILIFGQSFSQIDTIKSDGDYIMKSDKLIVATDQDSLLNENKRKPGRAALFSAIIPGAGQVYNKKYWKVPVVYSALGGVAFSINLFNNQYKKYLDLYHHSIDSSFTPQYIIIDNLTSQQLMAFKDSNRRNRDLSAVVFLVFYLLNIVDATVDAHLSDFDVSDNLSLNIKPEIFPLYSFSNTNSFGLTISFNFK